MNIVPACRCNKCSHYAVCVIYLNVYHHDARVAAATCCIFKLRNETFLRNERATIAENKQN